MEQFVVFVFALMLYPVLFIGIAVCVSTLYRWLRGCSYNRVATPCGARIVTAAVGFFAIVLMARGVPDALTSIWHWLTLAAYGIAMFAGMRWVYQHRDELKGWVRKTFELE
jgi:uncharacterized membrane protein